MDGIECFQLIRVSNFLQFKFLYGFGNFRFQRMILTRNLWHFVNFRVRYLHITLRISLNCDYSDARALAKSAFR